ncbi:hypothetical protein [Luteolibacter marinus]|uniref:hypothetical protein n=1 Tax=Luteolibacter marinus TaxID=2776705 RepID=UPI0018671F17|nr:hypothetical protein [Luteolibacter marinus]
MKRCFFPTLAIASSLGVAYGDLYYIQDEAQESLPLKWTAGVNLTYDDNVNPTAVGIGADDSAFSFNPYVGVSFVSISPQTTWDVYARIGAIYYFDSPAAVGSDDLYGQSRVGVNWTHRVSERLRFSSRNFLSYELEPDYAYGFATSRQLGEYFYWQTDNSVGYRWTERLATYTGFTLTGLDYSGGVANQDRFTWALYNQFRYQLTPQTVLTAEYRFAHTNGDGVSTDYDDHYILGGFEHRFSPNTILVFKAGAQIHDADAGSDSTSPYAEATLRTQVNEQFSIRSFLRYGVEGYDTVRTVGTGLYEFDDRRTFRLGVSGEYAFSQMLSAFGGIDYIPATFDDGRIVGGAGPIAAGGLDEDVWNAYVGLSVKFNEMLYGTVSYNYTDCSSDFFGQSYDRNRVNVGLRAEF